MTRVARRTRIVSLLVILLALGGLAHLVWSSMTGRGGRPVEGTRAVADAGGRELVYYERRPVPRARHPHPVVLLASLARSVGDFNELTNALVGAGFRTIAIESRGIGGSQGGGPGQSITLHDLAADIEVVLQHMGLDSEQPVHLVGHAFGNRVVRTYARDRPERAASVSLIAAGGLVPVSAKIERALLASVASFLPWSQRERALRLAFFSEGNEIPEYWRGGWWLWGGLAQGVATTSTRSDEFWDAGRARLLVLQAEDDVIAPFEDSGLRLLESFPERVELIRVPHAGHAFLPEQPDRIQRALLDFFEDVEGGRRR